MPEPTHLTEQSDYCFLANYKQGRAVSTVRGQLYPPDWQRHGYGASIVRRMQAKFARPIADVEAQYDRWQMSRHYGNPVREPTVKRKGQGRGL